VRTISRRLQRLEEGLGLGPETEHDRRLREQLEKFRRRAAERRAREGLPPVEADERQRERELYGSAQNHWLIAGLKPVASPCRP
jgi:hypothetical protein